VCRTPSHGCSERLEPDIGKLICPVLRGGGGGNVVSLLDAMRLTVMQQSAKSLPLTIHDEEDTCVLREAVVRELERLKWFLWHGNVYRALQVVESVEMDLDVAAATGDGTARQTASEHCLRQCGMKPTVLDQCNPSDLHMLILSL
jgi:hypothetical protein